MELIGCMLSLLLIRNGAVIHDRLRLAAALALRL